MRTSWIDRFLPSRKNDAAIRALAVAIEQRARALTPAPQRPNSAAPEDTLALLQSAEALLAQAAITPVAAVTQSYPSAPAVPAAVPASETVAEWTEGAATAPNARLESRAQETKPVEPTASAEPLPIPKENDAPSVFAQELIGLRDWLLASRSSEGANPERLLDGMDRKMQILLKREGFALLEATGPFQRERQEILETVPTGDPNLNDHVCETVRSGYLFHDTLFRPQQVVIYTYDPTLSQSV